MLCGKKWNRLSRRGRHRNETSAPNLFNVELINWRFYRWMKMGTEKRVTYFTTLVFTNSLSSSDELAPLSKETRAFVNGHVYCAFKFECSNTHFCTQWRRVYNAHFTLTSFHRCETNCSALLKPSVLRLSQLILLFCHSSQDSRVCSCSSAGMCSPQWMKGKSRGARVREKRRKTIFLKAFLYLLKIE